MISSTRFTRDMVGTEVILSGFFSSIGLFNQEVSCGMQQKADEIMEFLEIGISGTGK